MDRNVNPMQKKKKNIENPTDIQLVAAWLHSVPKRRGILLNQLPVVHSFFLYYFILEDNAYMSSAVCQIYDCAWQNYTRNYFSSM